MRSEQARLEARLERLEQQRALASVRLAAPPAPKAGEAAAPALTVVKMKPRREAAPRVETHVEVLEPPPGLVAELKATPQQASDPTDQAVAENQFSHGVESLRTGNVEGGVQELTRFAADWPHHAQADNALYFAGLGKMGLEDWEGAAQIFEGAVARYPAGDAVLDAMLKLAECRVRQSRPQDARAAWEKIVVTFPGTAAATQAQAKLATPAHPSLRSP